MPPPSTELTDALLRLARLVGAARPLHELLDAAAQTVAEALGYETVCVNLADELTGGLSAAAIHGSDAARDSLRGATSTPADWEPLLQPAFDRGGAFFVPAGAIDHTSGALLTYSVRRPPSGRATDWDAEDMLIVPLRRHDGSLLGTVSVDEPCDGRRPDDIGLAALVAMSAHVAHLIESARGAEAAVARSAALEAMLGVPLVDGDAIGAVKRLCAIAAERLAYRQVMIVDSGCAWLGPESVDLALDLDDDASDGARLLAFGPLPGPLPLADRERLLKSAALRVASLLNAAAQHALRRSEARKNTVLNASLDAIVTLDANGCISGFNPAAVETFGWKRDEALGQNLWQLAGAPGLPPEDRRRIAQSLLEHRGGRRVLTARRADGQPFPCEVSAARSHDLDGEVLYTVYLRDISDQRATAAALRAERDRARDDARHDRLTGVLNRDGFREDLVALLGERGGPRVLVGCVDVAGFASINQAFGREVGDTVLRTLAQRLRDQSVPHALVARTGSDEFMLAARPDEQELETLPRIRAALEVPVHVDGETELHVRVSYGLVFADDDDDPETVVNRAKSALERAGSTPDGIAWFRPGLDRPGADLALLAELRAGFTAGELELHYQPLVSLEDGRLEGYEALLRWRRDDGALVAPGEFIPLAESSGLIEPIGEWVIGAACEQLAAWDAAGHRVGYVAVNVSPRQLRRGTLPDVVAAAVARHGIAPGRLLLEVTEGVMAEGTAATELLERVRALGVRCALDDFGADHSSLARLAQLPVDVIKLDRSFLAGVPENPMPTRVAAAILELCAGLGLTTVVEGIETDAQLTFARGRAALGQGFLLGRPQPADVVAQPARRRGTASAMIRV